jgi:D-glycero-D-manno-heptose 1,7-bisphosphate phosphatase
MGIHPLKRAVFLDRDGVLNRALERDGKPYPPRNPEELEILPGVPEALALLKARGFLLIVVTNQPDVARGTLPRELLDAIHARLTAELPLDDIFICPHDDADACACRKPKPGLLLEAASKHGIDLASSFMVGDRWRDIDAGHAAGCTPILIDYQYRERPPAREPAARVRSLLDAVRIMEEG